MENLYSKQEILNKLKEDNSTVGRNSMGVSESFYNKFYMLQSFLFDKDINPENLDELELQLLLELAGFATEVFY